MTRHRTSIRTQSLGQVGLRPAVAAASGIEPWTFRAATAHPFEPGDAVPRCAAGDPELFWPATQTDVRAAQAVCSECPLAEECLAVGRARQEWGVWGGQLLAKGLPTTELPGNVRPEAHKAPKARSA
ncbi:MAG: WhiB family transcriptional regulator [Dermatophilaceae bacterium]|nr:WhiB family transcriptional regulator [Dermatophilaceae bacterium]